MRLGLMLLLAGLAPACASMPLAGERPCPVPVQRYTGPAEAFAVGVSRGAQATAAVPLSRVDPRYTSAATARKVEGEARIEAVVKGTGQSPHAFMLQAIEHETTRLERRQQFMADAVEAEKELLESGLYFDADEVHDAMDRRIRGGTFVRPKARSWRK